MDRQQTYALELLKRRLSELEQTHEVETKMLKEFVELRSDDLKSRIQRISRLCEQALSQTAVLETKYLEPIQLRRPPPWPSLVMTDGA